MKINTINNYNTDLSFKKWTRKRPLDIKKIVVPSLLGAGFLSTGAAGMYNHYNQSYPLSPEHKDLQSTASLPLVVGGGHSVEYASDKSGVTSNTLATSYGVGTVVEGAASLHSAMDAINSPVALQNVEEYASMGLFVGPGFMSTGASLVSAGLHYPNYNTDDSDDSIPS